MYTFSFFSFTVLSLAASATARSICSSPSRGCWKTLAPIPVQPRQEHATVALSDTKLAIIGGIVPNSDGTGVITTDMMQIYDLLSNSWETASPLPTIMNHPNAAVVGDRFYVLGGLTPHADGPWQATPECWVYDLEEDTWRQLADMPEGEARGSAAMGVFGSKIILAGGMEVLVPGPEGEQRTVSKVTTYDTKTGRWDVLPNLPQERDHAGGALIDGKMYVLGGRRFGQSNVTDTVFYLDLEDSTAAEKWQLSQARMPTARGGLAAGTVTIKDQDDDGEKKTKTVVYTFGGEGNDEAGSGGMFDQVEVFDPRDGGSWVEEGSMLIAKHGTAAVGIGGGIYIPGGGYRLGGSPMEEFEVYLP